MRGRVLALLLCVAALGIGVMIYSRIRRPEPVQYHSYTGDEPIPVRLNFTAPTTDLDSIAETSISREFLLGDLLALEGSLIMSRGEAPRPVVVQIVKPIASGKEVIANSATEIPTGDLRRFVIRINAPQKPGEYLLRVEWVGNHQYIARAKLKVCPKPM